MATGRAKWQRVLERMSDQAKGAAMRTTKVTMEDRRVTVMIGDQVSYRIDVSADGLSLEIQSADAIIRDRKLFSEAIVIEPHVSNLVTIRKKQGKFSPPSEMSGGR